MIEILREDNEYVTMTLEQRSAKAINKQGGWLISERSDAYDYIWNHISHFYVHDVCARTYIADSSHSSNYSRQTKIDRPGEVTVYF